MDSQMSIVSAGILLFLIMDPLGNIPIFLSLLKGVAPERRRRVLMRELLIALVVLFAFLLGGQYILKVLQLKQESVSIAGGIILFLIGVKMVFPPKEGVFGHAEGGEPFIVPMAIPGVAGPSAMAALLLLTHTQPGKLPQWALALFAAWFATALILWSATYLYRLLGESVLTALERLMGMILIALSVQMLLDGIAKYLHVAAV